jgi:hypothetical protein
MSGGGQDIAPASDVLTPAHAAALLRRQDVLQAEARTLLTELDLMRRLARIGTPTQVGSSALGLMVWRDVDVLVVRPGLDAARAIAALQPVLAHPRLAQARYINKSGAFNDTGRPQDARYFFALQYRSDDGADWNIDVSFWLADGPRPEVADLAAIAHQLCDVTRLAILWLKEIWHRLPAYHGEAGGRAISSRDIYDAVLRHGVRTPSDFDGYLRERGKPER